MLSLGGKCLCNVSKVVRGKKKKDYCKCQLVKLHKVCVSLSLSLSLIG